jgi:cation/acetate symporter
LTTQISIILALLIFARAGVVRIVRPMSDFYVAGRLMPAMLNGMAIAVSFMGVLVFVGLAGSLGPVWSGITAVLLGGGLGLILSGILLAPYLRQFGGYTLPDFLAERFGGDKMRPLAVLVLLACLFPALAACLLGLGLIATHAFPISLAVGVGAGVAMIFLCTLIGGMRSLSLSQIAQYAVLLVASLAAILFVLWQTGAVFDAEQLTLSEFIPSFGVHVFAQKDAANSFALIFCLAAGTASLPHLLMRSFTAPSPADARASFLISLLFVGLVCLALPAFAALYEAAWVGGGDGLSKIAGALLALAAIAGLLASGSALALSIGNALSYDIYYKSLASRASTHTRLLAARLSLVLATGLAGVAAVAVPEVTLIGTSVALSLAASAFLPALVLGIWWKRTSSDAALAGMVAGLVVCLYYMLAPQVIPFAFYESSSFVSDASGAQVAAYEALRQKYYLADAATQAAVLADWEAVARDVANWWGVRGVYAGVFGAPIGFLVTLGVSLFTRAPSEDVQRFVRDLRERTA